MTRMLNCCVNKELYFIQVIPQSFVVEYQLLIADSERHLDLARGRNSSVVEPLVDRLEAMLGIVEEGIQLLSTSIHVAEYSIVVQMRSNLTRYIRLIIYGHNDTTIPPVGVTSNALYYSGSAGRPKIVINITTKRLWLYVE